MSSADWIDDLERKAKAATPGPWSADGYGSGQQVTGAAGTIFADTLAFHEDAEFIAAADPATILRLIEDNRRLTHLLGSHVDGHRCTCTMTRPAQFTHEYGPEPAEWEQDPWCPTHPEMSHVRAEYDALAARLAAVEALVAEWERVQKQNRKALGELARGTSHLLLDTPCPADFRAALAAPTDTTKEN